MGFFNKYPYTDFHELNLDWILAKMKEIQEAMDGLLETAIEQATENAKAYIDEQLDDLENDFATLQQNFNTLQANYTSDFSTLSAQFVAYKSNIDGQIVALRTYITDGLEAQALQTNLLISQNNDYLLSEMENYLAQIKVINFFTGTRVTIQEMFNYLANLHLNDSIDYDTMAARARTYTDLVNMNISYTNLAMHGNSLYV